MLSIFCDFQTSGAVGLIYERIEESLARVISRFVRSVAVDARAASLPVAITHLKRLSGIFKSLTVKAIHEPECIAGRVDVKTQINHPVGISRNRPHYLHLAVAFDIDYIFTVARLR